jgi:hypothetical protein
MTTSVSLLIVLCAAIHVAEEYFCGWLAWTAQFVRGVTRTHFVVGNALFLALCVAGVVLPDPAFRLSLAALLLWNALVHLVPTVVRREYSPGVVSALLLYVPLGVHAYAGALHGSMATSRQVIASVPMGLLWMIVPFLYQALRISRGRP